MSDTAIADVGRSLVELLRVGLGFPEDTNDVTLASPAEVEEGSRVSLFLYSVIENPDLKNAPRQIVDPNKKNEPRQVIDPKKLYYPPLSLNLYYLLTAYASQDIVGLTAQILEAHEILGKAMRILYDNGIITGTKLRGSLATRNIELRMTLNPITVEDLTRIWSVFPEENYRTSVSYLVTPVPIDSQRDVTAQRVVSKQADHDQMIPRPEET